MNIRGSCLYCARLAQLVFFDDTTHARFGLGVVATFWAVGLWLPGDTFERPTYALMRDIYGASGERIFAIAWTFYALVALWRSLSSSRVPTWIALTFNSFGVMLFSAYPASILAQSLKPFPAGIAADVFCWILSVWVLIRTHFNKAPGWRCD